MGENRKEALIVTDKAPKAQGTTSVTDNNGVGRDNGRTSDFLEW
jgi:hypothetical protein